MRGSRPERVEQGRTILPTVPGLRIPALSLRDRTSVVRDSEGASIAAPSITETNVAVLRGWSPPIYLRSRMAVLQIRQHTWVASFMKSFSTCCTLEFRHDPSNLVNNGRACGPVLPTRNTSSVARCSVIEWKP